MSGTLSKLTRHLMGDRKSSASKNLDEVEHVDQSALRRKIGYLSAIELFSDFTLLKQW